MIIIKGSNIVKEYGSKMNKTQVIKGINLTIESGEFVSVVGPSGSGKTTLLYLLSGLEPYTDGSIQLFDKELNTYSSSDTANLRQTKIGFVFQSYNLIGNLNVYENVLISAVIAGKSDKNRVHEALEMVGMLEYKDLYPNQISGGMQQRVSIARALVNDPEIIFADEPTGNLDHHNGLQIMEILKQLNQNYHKTIILVTHNEDLLFFGTRTIRLNDGLIIEDVETIK